jgi:hypothetical protein
MSIRTILFASILACLGAAVGQESAALAQPVMPPPPAPTYVPQDQVAPAYPPPAPTYDPQPPAPASPPQQPAYPPPQQQPAPAYPPPQQQPATGYAQPGQAYPQQGYPPPQQQGYPPPQQGYPPPQQQSYPPPQQSYPPQQPQDYPPPPPAEPKSESVFSNPLSKLQVGFHLGTGSLTADNPTYDSDLSSLGIFARYRFNKRWEAELAAASESGTVVANGAQRAFRPITASALWHAFDLRGVDVYARGGLGRATEVYDNPAYPALEGSTTHLHIGAGATYIFRRNIGAGVEMRYQSIRRSAGDLSALNASGAAYSLFGAYHF